VIRRFFQIIRALFLWTLIIGVGGCLIQGLILWSGSQDLIIKPVERTIELPLTFKRWKRMIVPFSDITSVSLEKVRRSSRYGTVYTYASDLHIRQHAAQRLVDMKNEKRAESFVAWLRLQLGLVPDA